MNRLQKLRLKDKRYTIAILVVSVIIIFMLLYYIGNGFSLNDNVVGISSDFGLTISHPLEGQTFFPEQEIEVSGTTVGGTPSKVYVWDERYNVPVTCAITGPRFGIRLLASDLSAGHHILNVQAQSTDGKWSQVQKVTIKKEGGYAFQPTWVESNLPQPLAIVFRPVEEIVSGIVVLVSGGTAPDDLNGDNIQDIFQQSPVVPRYNPMNVPLTSLIVFIVLAAVILILIFYVIKPYVKERQSMEKELRRSPEQRQYFLNLKKLRQSSAQAKLRTEKRKTKKLETELKKEKEIQIKLREEKLKEMEKRPVNIYLNNNKKGSKKTNKKGSKNASK